MNAMERLAINEKQRDVDVLMATATKHYMRREVWLRIATERQQQVVRPIRYFTLTTADLFDVKLLERAGLIERTTRGYPGVGFCEKDDKTYSDIVRALRWCGLSHKGTFEDMALQNSGLGSQFWYDVVNLDFTWVPFRDKESPLEGTWGAIKRLLEVQREKDMSFDLFLTFRGSREGTDEKAIAQVAELLGKNLDDGRGIREFENQVGHLDPFRLLQDDYVRFLCMGLPKLLISEALNLGFEMSRAKVFKYPREGEHGPYEIVKFAFGLEALDLTQRTFAQPPHSVRSYDQWVPHIFNETVIDIADILEAAPDLREQLEKDLESLGRP